MTFCSADPMCPSPVDIVNGMVAFTGNSIGDNATYICNSSFELIGMATTTCTQVNASSAEFQPMPPSCRREYTEYTFDCALNLFT